MPSIYENRFFTVMAVFEVAPQQQQELIDGIADQVEEHIKKFPGFVSASFHASDDGRKVVNYAQWHSKESWQKAPQAPNSDKAKAAIEGVIKRCEAKSVSGDSFSFRVARVVENEL
ncbi:Antibiotic biosynthesis monooxygenase [Salibacterium halotolerans]|uniref:Antibiotic biosynthesis monooxygenase n=2 Tax=Salibacterium halotolerans TaxID=1884432 RepID=A0A1I5YEA8_9BACI|nr:Antibiotic biosynthesis monooxygenase [Salibacterium halotolerans]